MKQNLQLNKFWFTAKLALTLLTLFITVSGYAQERTVTGVITDESNIPLPGVNVVIKGTTTGTVTDINGNYSIKVPGNETTLSISYVGYEKQEMVVGNQTAINFTLKEETTQLNDVVVIGYGVQKKKLVTGATVQVSNKDLEKNHVTRLESALQGITPGMVIIKQNGQPGSDYNISIRGLSSPNNNTPLVLVDGVPGSLNSLNPEDIESVDVLKDAASAAIYGSRGGNGVILITTKKGKSGGEAVISFDTYYGISNLAKKVDVLNAKQYATILNEAQKNQFPNIKKPHFDPAAIDTLGEGTNWLDLVTNKNAPSRNYHLGITGGGEKSSYAISLSYTTEEGILDWENKSKYERIGFMINTDNKVKSYLRIGENISYSHRVSKALGNGDMYGNFLYDILTADPTMPLYGPNNYGTVYGVSTLDKKLSNPIATMHFKNNGINKYDDVVGDIFAELQIAKGLKFRTDFGANLSFRTFQDHIDSFKISSTNFRQSPDYKQEMYRTFSYNFDNIITYEKSIDKHNLLLMAGTNAQDNWFFNVISELEGEQSNIEPVLTNVTKRDSVIKIEGDYGKADSRYSYFGRLSYNYDEKYLLTASIRRDASSRFGTSKRVGIFPAASVGWVISRENFMQTTSSWLDFIKIRASWGKNGNEPTEKFAYMATVTSLSRYYTFGGNRTTGTSPDRMANPQLQWEASEQTNVGFDSRFLKNFYLNFDWYQKNSDNWIVPHPVPAYTGRDAISTTLPFVNGGNVVNKGIEFEVGYNKTFGDFSLDIKANMSYNTNKVTSVKDSLIQGSKDVLYNGSEELYRVQEGFPLGYFWGYKTNGIFQDTTEINNYTWSYPSGNKKLIQPGAQPGDVRFVDLNGDGTIDQLDKTQIGDPIPHYIFGFNIGTSYKGVDFSVNIQGVAGNSIVQSYRSLDAQLSNYTTEILKRWTGPGTSNKLPRVTESGEANRNWRNFSDISVQDGSFVRLKSVNLGFDLKKLIFKKLPVQQLRIYVSGINLWTITKYTGFDPEIGYGSHLDKNNKLIDPYASGVDLGNYPSARTYLLGLNLKF